MSAAEQAQPYDVAVEAGSTSVSPTALLAARIDLLYRLGRHHLSLVFGAFVLATALYAHNVRPVLGVLGFALPVLATLATAFVTRAYLRRSDDETPELWARRFVIASLGNGAAWGFGAIVWFVPGSVPAEAFLTVAFLGMTACEYIARSAYRPAYLAHALLSLGPLVFLLAREGNIYTEAFAATVLLFAAVLYGFCEDLARMLDEHAQLRQTRPALVRRLHEEKLEAERARDLAQTSVRASSVFISNISHELRTPLNALLGMAQLLDRSQLDRAQKSHVKVMLEAGRGLKMLLDDVIALSSDGADQTGEEQCDAAQAVRTVGWLLQPQAWEKELRLTVSAPTDLPRAAADPRRIRQVLLKLADNAVKFTQRGAVEIVVAAHAHEDGTAYLRFTISDTGIGVPPEIAKHMFEPFLAQEGSYARRSAGTGLGLAVARHLVEQMGGEMGFVSEAGEGAAFWFTIPALSEANNAEQEDGQAASDALPPGGMHLLAWLADEGQGVQLANLLEPFGNRISFAKNAQDAIGRVGRERFDAVIAGGEDADLIAAAPGGKVPILALVVRGGEKPVAAGQMLRWPARPGALYAALRDLLGRGADSGTSRSDEPAIEIAAIDATAFAALEKSLGISTLVEILQSYIQTAEGLCTGLRAAVQGESWEEAARIAQDIAGAAGGLGLAALTAAARGFTQKARESTAAPVLQEAAASVMGEHQRVRRALGNLYPELAA
ncbi:MAG TPA: ATP-binding protein [Rhizomicrobium sp.]|jgi:signal transduction histidine kinase/HPt (histidine-containing phosphotransfer) domain-containing protein